VDLVVDRRQLKETVARLLRHMLGKPAAPVGVEHTEGAAGTEETGPSAG
jgi:hypothetical protein